jgi:hypothetical protein
MQPALKSYYHQGGTKKLQMAIYIPKMTAEQTAFSLIFLKFCEITVMDE